MYCLLFKQNFLFSYAYKIENILFVVTPARFLLDEPSVALITILVTNVVSSKLNVYMILIFIDF